MVGHVATRPLVLTLTTPATTTSTLGALTPTRSRSRRISATPLSVIAEYATAEVRSHLLPCHLVCAWTLPFSCGSSGCAPHRISLTLVLHRVLCQLTEWDESPS